MHPPPPAPPNKKLTNAANLEARAGQGTQSRLGTRAWGLGAVAPCGPKLDVQGSDAQLLQRGGVKAIQLSVCQPPI